MPHTDTSRLRRHLAAMAMQATTEAAIAALRDLLDAQQFIGRLGPSGARYLAANRAARQALRRHDEATVEMAATIEAETRAPDVEVTP
jgi:hypothetical protein